MIIPKNLEELASYVESDQKVVFFFTADWCPDCQFIYPVMPEIEALHPDMTFVRVNRDDYMALAQTWNIFGIPSFVVTQKGQELNTYKKENNLPTHQTIPREMELFDEFKEKLTPLAQKHLTDNCYKRGFSASFGSPGTYDFVLEPCRAKFIMKSKAKMFLEFSYGNDFWYHKQFIVKLTESDWKIDKISYRYGSNDDSWHVSRF